MAVVIQASVNQTLDSAIHRINHYKADSLIGFPNTYPLDSDLSDGQRYYKMDSWVKRTPKVGAFVAPVI